MCVSYVCKPHFSLVTCAPLCVSYVLVGLVTHAPSPLLVWLPGPLHVCQLCFSWFGYPCPFMCVSCVLVGLVTHAPSPVF